MARWALLLLAVFAVGFLLGRLTATPGRAEPRAPLAGHHPARSPPPVVQPAASPAGEPQSPETAPRDVPETSADVVPPGPVVPEADAESGILEVDFSGWAGERTAWVGWRNARGGQETWEESPDSDSDGTLRFELDPGTFDVWWLDPEDGRRRGTSAQVQAGRLTTVRVTEHRGMPPLAEGLGLLEVHVAASWGGGMRVDVVVGGFLEDVELGTNGQGWASAALAPGRYSIRVGDQESEAVLERGRATLHRVQHRDEGDLIVEVSHPSHDIRIVPAGAELDARYRERYLMAPTELLFPYVTTREYDVYYLNGQRDKLGVHLGTVEVQVGRTARFRYALPRGGLDVRVRVPGLRYGSGPVVEVKPVGRPGGVLRLGDHYGTSDLHAKAVLAPGRYVVTALANNCDAESRQVDVGDFVVPLTFELETTVLGR